jgi:hypothetical protein
VRTSKYGFLLTEALVAILVLGMVSGSIFFMVSASNRTTLDAYHQLLREQIAQEIIMVFRSIGYGRLSECHEQYIADYRLNEWQPVEARSKETGVTRPDACSIFERKITIQQLEKDGIRAILLRVAVRPQAGRNDSEHEIVSSALLVEQP